MYLAAIESFSFFFLFISKSCRWCGIVYFQVQSFSQHQLPSSDHFIITLILPHYHSHSQILKGTRIIGNWGIFPLQKNPAFIFILSKFHATCCGEHHRTKPPKAEDMQALLWSASWPAKTMQHPLTCFLAGQQKNKYKYRNPLNTRINSPPFSAHPFIILSSLGLFDCIKRHIA